MEARPTWTRYGDAIVMMHRPGAINTPRQPANQHPRDADAEPDRTPGKPIFSDQPLPASSRRANRPPHDA